MIYNQSTGQLTHDDGTPIGTGYAGNGPGLNNPAMQDVHNVGPLPRGCYTLGTAYHDGHLGPEAMFLNPDAGNEMCGRSGFFIHASRFIGDMDASEGCIVLNQPARHAVAIGADRRLVVMCDLAPETATTETA